MIRVAALRVTGLALVAASTVLVAVHLGHLRAGTDASVGLRAPVIHETAPTSTSSPAPRTETRTETVTAAVLVETVPRPAPPAVTTGCADALAYLSAHQAPGFVDVCGPGTASGHYGFTCWNVAGRCPNGAKVIRIACPAPFVYMNEAHNSWSLVGRGSGIDPYGQGTSAEQAFCDRLT